MPKYRHWSNTACDGERVAYTYDGPDTTAVGDDATIELVAERTTTGPTNYHGYIEWHIRLTVNGTCAHDFAESHPDDVPAGSKQTARHFAARWARLHPRPLTSLGVTTMPTPAPAGACPDGAGTPDTQPTTTD